MAASFFIHADIVPTAAIMFVLAAFGAAALLLVRRGARQAVQVAL
jgi:hypothetical protein